MLERVKFLVSDHPARAALEAWTWDCRRSDLPTEAVEIVHTERPGARAVQLGARKGEGVWTISDPATHTPIARLYRAAKLGLEIDPARLRRSMWHALDPHVPGFDPRTSGKKYRGADGSTPCPPMVRAQVPAATITRLRAAVSIFDRTRFLSAAVDAALDNLAARGDFPPGFSPVERDFYKKK